MPGLRLALLSHHDPRFGTATYQRLRGWFPQQRPRLAYLASDLRRLGPYFYVQQEIYARFGLALDDLAEVTDGFRPELLGHLQQYSGLHLSGGNTPRFLALLRQQGLVPHVKNFAGAGSVIVGVSAGAILQTPSLHTAQAVGDDFTEADADWAALGLVDFHFWPHYTAEDEAAAQALAAQLGRPLHAAPDGSGVLVEGTAAVALTGTRVFTG
ncbi:Type 1 glutamine amidotransferase-like domain-containing protein [Deinococcus lacus]|uniref:Type 1 glutamine amidotransferase-like domain-containing protein n=1 Tax=Deinococcus lacus TaxID=392561 RepID=A0ABW1YBU3_9DEIO